MCCLNILVDGPVTYHCPSRGFPNFGVQPIFLIKSHGFGHDNRGGASYGNETKGKIFSFKSAFQTLFGNCFCCVQWKNASYHCCRGTRTNHFHKPPAIHFIIIENSADHCVLNCAIHHVLFCFWKIIMLVILVHRILIIHCILKYLWTGTVVFKIRVRIIRVSKTAIMFFTTRVSKTAIMFFH